MVGDYIQLALGLIKHAMAWFDQAKLIIFRKVSKHSLLFKYFQTNKKRICEKSKIGISLDKSHVTYES